MQIEWERSRFEPIQFAGRDYIIKRDDLLLPIGGNKARKLCFLSQQDLSSFEGIVSYGGAQSNAMLALAQFCQIHSLSFQYYTRPVPNWLKQSPIGNLAGALDYKMQWRISETGQPPEIIDNNYLLVPQGITMPEAELGIRKLALEIEDYCKNKIIPDAAIVLPSGTGATALYLQQHLKQTVHTIPCIGNEQVLQQFFKQQLPNAERYPSILNSAERDLPFGKPHPDLLSIYSELRESTGIEFELLYDAKAWLYLTKWECDKPIIYIHNGGISGNSSMLSRYRRLGLWND